MSRRAAVIFLVIFVFVSSPQAAIRFAKFRFQPEKKYDVVLNVRTEMTTSAGAAGGQFPDMGKEAGNIELQIQISIDMETSQIKDSVLPFKMRFSDVKMEASSGGQKLPLTMPKSDIRKQEYQGEFKEDGEVVFSKIPLEFSYLQDRGVDFAQILYIIPQFPDRGFSVGDSFELKPRYASLSSYAGENQGKIKYKIKKIEGQDVFIDARMNSKLVDTSGGVRKENVLGSTGTVIYSLRDKICRSVKSDLILNTKIGADPKKPSSVIVNEIQVGITIEPVQ